MGSKLSGFVLLFLTGFSYGQNSSTLITEVRIIDGTGIPAYVGSVRVKGNQIVAVGNLQALPGEQVIKGQNKFLCPGFIDAHSHHFSSLRNFPQAAATNNQGIYYCNWARWRQLFGRLAAQLDEPTKSCCKCGYLHRPYFAQRTGDGRRSTTKGSHLRRDK